MAKTNYCTIYLVRHAQTEANVKGIFQGHSDYPLTKEGINQAIEAGKRLKNVHFDAVFSSDLLRAKRTAELIILEKKIAVKTSQVLRERSFGIYERKDYSTFNNDLRNLFVDYEKLGQKEKFTFKFHKDIENDEELATRLILFLREIAVAYAGKTILMVSHGGIMRAALMHLGFGTYKTIPFGAIKNLAYFKLESDGVDFFVKETWNVEVK